MVPALFEPQPFGYVDRGGKGGKGGERGEKILGTGGGGGNKSEGGKGGNRSWALGGEKEGTDLRA